MFKLFLKRTLPTIIILTVWIIFTHLPNFKLNLSWFQDINIWLNAVVLELFIFNLMSCITIKIKNPFFQTTISLILSLIIGETIKYDFNCLDLSFFNISQICILIISFILSGFLSFSKGVEKSIKLNQLNKQTFEKKVVEMSNNDYQKLIKEFNRSIAFMKKYTFASTLIKENSIRDLEFALKEIEKIKK